MGRLEAAILLRVPMPTRNDHPGRFVRVPNISCICREAITYYFALMALEDESAMLTYLICSGAEIAAVFYLWVLSKNNFWGEICLIY